MDSFVAAFLYRFFSLLLLTGLLSAGPGKQLQQQFWIVFNESAGDIRVERVAGNLASGDRALDELLAAFQVSQMRQEMPNARPQDRNGDFILANVWRLTIPDRSNLAAAIRQFDNHPLIFLAEAIPLATIFDPTIYSPDDPLYSTQWAPQKIQAPQAWGLWGGAQPAADNVVVAIFDSGVEWDHPDLIGNIWVNPGEDVDGDGAVGDYDSLAAGGDLNGIDDDGNGYIDDLVGWDFCGPTIGDPNNPSYMPDNDPHSSPAAGWLMHGTHVAGCAAAATDNATGVAAPGFNAKIMPVKFAFDDDINHAADGIYEQPAAYLYAAQSGADIINCSYGYGTPSMVVENTIATIYNNYDCIVVAAAGNDGNSNFNYPAAYPFVIAVAATNSQDIKASFSSFGSFVDISAPGEGILSTVYQNVDGGYQSLSGTSMASPTAAGALALLKAFFPNENFGWLSARLMDGADDIDALNPAFAGQLGSGRVNIYRAISQWIHPELALGSDSLVIDDANGDGQFNPGESASLWISLDNISVNNVDARSIQAVLRSTNSGVLVSDSIAMFADISGGGSADNLSDPFVFSVSENIAITTVDLQVEVLANHGTSYPYHVSIPLQAVVSINQAGWPQSLSGEIRFSAAVIDLDLDGEKEIVAGSVDGNLHVWQADGSPASGFPYSAGAEINGSPAIGDLDNDGDYEIVIASRDSQLYVLNHDGSVLNSSHTGRDLRGAPSLSDLDNNGGPEIILATFDGRILVKNPDGSDWGNFPLNLGVSNRIASGVAVGDINGDLVPDLVFGTFFGNIYAVSSADATVLPGFPVAAGIRIAATPAIVDPDGPGPLPTQIVSGSWGQRITIVDGSGNISGSYPLGARIDASPVIADLDNDGTAEIIVGTAGSEVHALHFDGTAVSGFPVGIGGAVSRGAVIADFDNAGGPEIVVPATDNKLYILNGDGSHFRGSPISLDETIPSIATVSDLDNDGDLEIVAAASSEMHIFDISGSGSSDNYWFTDQADYARTANWQNVLIAIGEPGSPVIPSKLLLHQNYPNPFNPSTTIRFSIPESGRVLLKLYNILGELVSVLVNEEYPAGEFRLNWNAENLPGGVYFYKLETPQNKGSVVKKMVLLK